MPACRGSISSAARAVIMRIPLWVSVSGRPVWMRVNAKARFSVSLRNRGISCFAAKNREPKTTSRPSRSITSRIVPIETGSC